MKTITSLLLVWCAAALPGSAQSLETDTAASAQLLSGPDTLEPKIESVEYVPGELGLHQRTWLKATTARDAQGNVSTNTEPAYVELADGLGYWDEDAQEYRESREEIQAYPNGAAALAGQTRVLFAKNLATPGAITLKLANGQELRSNVRGLSYFDWAKGKSVWVAQIRDDCEGVVLPPNQVAYPNAMSGVRCTVLYTYHRDSFSQDLLIESQVPLPEDFGLSSESSMLQVITEFLAPEQPTRQTQLIPLPNGEALANDDLDFGSIRMGSGTAFSLGADAGEASIPVLKEWTKMNNLDVLVEQVPVPQVLARLKALPKAEGASVTPPGSVLQRLASATLEMPARPTVKRPAGKMELAQGMKLGPGLVLDYQTLSTGQSNYVVRGDLTTYVSANVTLAGTTVFEAGAVLKFNSNSPTLTVNGPVVWKGTPARPVICTARHDASVGETIGGGSGDPYTNYYANVALKFSGGSTVNVQNLRVSFAKTAIALDGGRGHMLGHVQLVSCQKGICPTNTDFALRNALLWNVQTNFCGSSATGRVEHVTVDGAMWLNYNSGCSPLCLTNSLLVAVTNLGTLTSTSAVAVVSSGSGVFQTLKAGKHYLANNNYRDCGTTNINPALWADLKRLTTYPPLELTNDFTVSTTLGLQAPRATGSLSLGYHYPALDYLWTSLNLTNATLTLTNGVAVGFYGRNALCLRAGAKLVSEGGPVNMNRLVRCTLVQEQPVVLGATAVGHLEIAGSYSPRPLIQMRFTDLPAAGGSSLAESRYLSYGFYPIERVTLRDCWLRGGSLEFHPTDSIEVTFAMTNNLVERGSLYFSHGYGSTNTPMSVYLYNNLFWAGTLNLEYTYGTPISYNPNLDWYVYDNALDNVSLSESGTAPDIYIRNGNNGYVNTSQLVYGTSNVIVGAFTYTNSWLGNFYQVSTNFLNKGSRGAAVAGLYHHTVLASQAKETNSVVDLGFHNIAVDASGIPIDSDGDGTPDYLEDVTGDGNGANDPTSWLIYNSPNGLSGGNGLQVFTPLK